MLFNRQKQVSPSNEGLILERETWRIGDDAVISLDLPPLYKKNARGNVQELTYALIFRDGAVFFERRITCPGMKDRVSHSNRLGGTRSKYFSQIIEDSIQLDWNKKVRKQGWSESIQAPVIQFPMKYKRWEDAAPRYPCWGGPKLNGVAFSYKPGYGILSNNLRPYDIPHLLKSLETLGMTVIGEIWNPHLTLEEIVSLLSSSGEEEQKLLQAWVYNRPQGSPKYRHRLSQVEVGISNYDVKDVFVVPVSSIENEEAALRFAEIIEEKVKGTDGVVFHNEEYEYQWGKRSRDVIKLKRVIDREYICTDISWDEDAEYGALIRLHFETDEGKEFTVIPNWSKERRAKEVNANHIGYPYTLEFREYTKYGVPRHVMSCTRRDYE